ncbi:MAG: DegT/DnrJ/EryC1/StrS family aminotransferase [Micavibrio sp.]|nr:DegT/DnrJ/EryC1/StrS family aminotransferase [Micavibrio sp.]
MTAKLEEIWHSGIVTNHGPQLCAFERTLSTKLENGGEAIALCNGTSALMAALAACDLEGEVITTPFSFVATAHAISSLGLTPKFVDIDPNSLCLDPKKVVAAITDKTCAILGVHIYGNPCAPDEFEALAKKYGLKLIYDAAHAFGAMHQGKSLVSYGDVCALSFHATKSFHTIEGGAVVTSDSQISERIKQYRNFGLDDHKVAQVLGINGKMNEIQAAIGLLNLEDHAENTAHRKAVYKRYVEELSDLKGLKIIQPFEGDVSNYSYCPLRVSADFSLNRDRLLSALDRRGIIAQRYFYPLITDMPVYKEYAQEFPVASKASKEMLCLPIYPDLSPKDQRRVIDIIIKIARGIEL